MKALVIKINDRSTEVNLNIFFDIYKLKICQQVRIDSFKCFEDH